MTDTTEDRRLDLVWKEYDMLRREMTDAGKVAAQTLILLLGAVGAILSFSFSGAAKDSTSPVFTTAVVLLASFVTFLGGSLVGRQRRQIWRLSTYMSIFLEPELAHVRWERRMNKAVALKGSESFSGPVKEMSSLAIQHERTIILSTQIVCAGSLLINRVIAPNPFDLKTLRSPTLFIPLVIIAGLAIVTQISFRNLKRGGAIQREFRRLWCRLRDEEQGPATQDDPCPGTPN